MYPFLYKKRAYLTSTVIKVWDSDIGSFCPKLSEKEGCRTGAFYSGYTIKDYLTLGKGFIFAASGKLAPFREKQNMLHSSIIIQKIAIGMLACQWRFLNYELRAYTRFLPFPGGAQTTLTRRMETLPSEDKLIIV